VFHEDRKKHAVERQNSSASYVVSNLPADAATVVQRADALSYYGALLLHVLLNVQPWLILFPQIVRRRSDDQLERAVRHGRQELKAVAAEKRAGCPAVEAIRNGNVSSHEGSLPGGI
jgi:hypothetical protein